MNDDLVVSKILKLLENNTAFIGYALNGGVGTKINVRNTETGKTIQALSINVDSSGEVLVVKDSEDNQYKAVTFKTAEKVTERIIQLRKTKPIDDKKVIEYTDSDIEVFYLFVKLIDTGSPVPSQLTSTWIRKGNSCTQFVSAYERCNFGAKESIDEVRYQGLPYIPYESLSSCLADDGGRDAKTPNGSKDDRKGVGSKMYVSKLDSYREGILLEAITSHDNHHGTNYKNFFGYGSTVACTGTFDIMGYRLTEFYNSEGEIDYYAQCFFGTIPNPYSVSCSYKRELLGHCSTGYTRNKIPQIMTYPDGTYDTLDNTTSLNLGWDDLPFEFMYSKSSFVDSYTSFGAGWYLFQASDEEIEQILAITPGLYEFIPFCPQGGTGGPYNGEGFEDRLPDVGVLVEKRDMKLSTHKAEIWLGSSKKKEAIKLYELGLSDLFSSIYSPFITRADETRVDIAQHFNQFNGITEEDYLMHEVFYKNRDKNTIDLLLDPRVWIYILDNQPRVPYNRPSWGQLNPKNLSLQYLIDSLYNRTINMTVLDKKNLVVHLKLGLVPKNNLNNNDCAGKLESFSNQEIIMAPQFPSQSWEYQKYVTIKIQNWQITSISNSLDTSNLGEGIWNKSHIERKFLTSFGEFVNDLGIDQGGNSYPSPSIRTIGQDFLFRTMPNNLLLRPDENISLESVFSGDNFEQYNYSVTNIPANNYSFSTYYNSLLERPTRYTRVSGTGNPTLEQYNAYRYVGLSTNSWWALWDKSHYNSKTQRLSSITGYEMNLYQIVTSWKLDPNLDYSKAGGNVTGQFQIIQDLGSNTYFEYLPNRPLVMIPSIIKSVRDKKLTSNALEFIYKSLTSRDLAKSIYGLNFYFSDTVTQWTSIDTTQRTDILNSPNPQLLELPFMLIPRTNQTRELNINWRNYPQNANCKRIDTTRWINNLWAQFIFTGEIKVDVDSYKNVKYTPPTNPSQYIKFAADSSYLNTEFSFTPKNYTSSPIPTETVLSPGTLDIAKQVKITKPTNVDLDPNMSFLVYLYPFVEVTKKKKTI